MLLTVIAWCVYSMFFLNKSYVLKINVKTAVLQIVDNNELIVDVHFLLLSVTFRGFSWTLLFTVAFHGEVRIDQKDIVLYQDRPQR